MPRILVTDDDAAIRQSLELHFQQAGHEVVTAANGEEALDIVGREPVDVVISDVRMPGMGGLALLTRLREEMPELPVIIMTAFHDLDTTITALHGGAVDYVPKPIDVGNMDAALQRALEQAGKGSSGPVESDGTLILKPDTRKTIIVGESHAMQNVFKQIALVSQSRATVLLQGESGTGKELVARAIHQASQNRDAPFMAVHCAALVENLLESELFGHARGAFTGAVSTHKGKVEQVGSGTLFLDEIAELSPIMQGKMLRILEAREYSPVGSTEIKKTDARFITATNVNLRENVHKGLFREDLFYRLNVVVISMPPLRERRICIPALVNHLLLRINRDLRRHIQGVTADAMHCLIGYNWPGNVRELENVLMKTAVMERGSMLTRESLPKEVNCDRLEGTPLEPIKDEEELLSLKELERRYISRVLEQVGWHKGKACEILGISRPKLQRHIEEFNLEEN